MNTIELKEVRAKLIHDARQIINKADSEKRDLLGDESQKVEELFSEAEKIETKIDTEEKRQAVEAAEARLKETTRRTKYNASHVEEPDASHALRCWAMAGRGSRINGADIENAARCGIDLTASEICLKMPSKRAMAKSEANKGANAVAWTDFYNGFFEELKYYGPVLDLVTIHDSDNGNSLPIPIIDDTSNSAAILAEGSEVTAADPTIAKVTLGAFKYESKEVPVSLELLQDSSFDLDSYLRGALASRFGRAWNAHITTGAGTTLPFGLTARATASGVVAGGTGAAPAFTDVDKFIDLQDSVDDSYRRRPGVGFMMHRATLSKLRKLKDDNGQYILQPDVTGPTPYTLLGDPVYVNPDMPSSGVDAILVLYGDFKNYMWRRVSGIDIFRLDEIRIRFGQVVFLGFARGDGNLIQAKCVKSMAAAAS